MINAIGASHLKLMGIVEEDAFPEGGMLDSPSTGLIEVKGKF